MEENLKQKTINGMLWQFLQKISGQLISFIISVILARILSPSDYGLVALAGMFLVLMGIFSNGGLAPALIQKKEVDDEELNTMFVTQLVFASILYVIVFFCAPIFAGFFKSVNTPLLISVIRVLALTMPLGSLIGVQYAVVTRRLMFKWYFYANLVSLVVSGSIGLYMAYNGYGAWALVGQSISSTITTTIVIFCLLDWHPKFRFSYSCFKPLFSQGLKYMGTTLIGTITSQVKGYALGLKYSAADLAYYNRGEGIPNLLCNNIDDTIQSVLFPSLSKIQDDREAVRHALRRAIRISTFVLMPMLFGLAAVSDKVVIIVFTEKWAPSIPFMQVLCFCLAIGIMCNVNLQALKAIGKIGLIFKLEFIKKPIMLFVILGTMMISPLAIAWGILFFNIFVYFVNSYPNKKSIGYSYKQQLIDVCPNFIMAFGMASVVYLIGRLALNIYLLLTIQIISGIFIYLLASLLTKNESMCYVYNSIKAKFQKK